MMKLLEASGEEVNDQLYDCLQRDLLSPRDGRYFKSYFVGDLAISLIETKQIIRLSIYKKLMLVLMPPPPILKLKQYLIFAYSFGSESSPKCCMQGWGAGAGAGCFWILRAGAGPAPKKPGDGAGAAKICHSCTGS